MELHTHAPKPPYNPTWGNTPRTLDSWSASAVAKLYDQDLYAWANTNAQLLREKKYDQLDMSNLIEEIEDMAKSEQRSIFNHMVNLLLHLLKWEFQPAIQSRSWKISVTNARIAIDRLIEDSPSLRNAPQIGLEKAYADAKRFASQETGLAQTAFPASCPYPIEQVLAHDWLPT
jgi:hypothetical protein